MSISITRLKECLSYDLETGQFTWLVSQGRAVVGMPAGSPHKDGYIQIKIDRVLYKAHRLAWFYVFGALPVGRLDHRDNVGSNNCISNLRQATHVQNMCNRKVAKNNKCGIKGVCFDSRIGKFNANINFNKVRYNLGYFSSLEEAAAAYWAKATELHGEFARAA